MSRQPTPFADDFVQTEPALGILRLAALIAEAEAEPDEESLDAMSAQVAAQVFDAVDGAKIWPELARGLMARAPSRMVRLLRDCGALAQFLPETAALFGVPQITDEASPVDIGAHLLKALDEAALCAAPLEARFALLLMNVGKADSPPEHLPSHYRHVERGLPRVEAICRRFEAPAECRDLALLALGECERVHRVSKARAGPVAALLDRLGAFEAPERFLRLMSVCACDYRAYGGRSGQPYPKAELLDIALRACRAVGAGASGASGEDGGAASAQSARAEAIARAFNSQRWSQEAP